MAMRNTIFQVVLLLATILMVAWAARPLSVSASASSAARWDNAGDTEEAPTALTTTPKADFLMMQAQPRVKRKLAGKDLQLGQPIFIRIFKLSKELEVWMLNKGKFRLFKRYSICSYSGYVGPKLYEGDWQSPEGFYTVSAEQMNPKSRFHLSFNIGYPNKFDTERNCTGSAIMVHGKCVSEGCFAMGNRQIEEIYLLAYQAFLQGQESFSIHIFPFRMTKANLSKHRSSPWYGFWSNLTAGYNAFERNHQVPVISSKQGRYIYEEDQQQWIQKRWVLIQEKKKGRNKQKKRKKQQAVFESPKKQL
ncbi:MAG: 2-dehydro-3-deoxyphosphooctonate aldolase [Candidatus Electrothrix sp. AR4]|nr:2-dehydro-3-deoxyphosphooctonate aldolase [Candidatus Electrothrix sp. AR4]